MRTKAMNKRLHDLMVLLRDIGALHRDLLQKVRDKAEAMRQGDVQAIQTCTRAEHNLVVRIQQREGLRRQLMDMIGKDLGLPAGQARTLSASKLARKLDEPHRTRVTELADQLRVCMTQLAKENRVSGTIARGVLVHLQGIFQSIGASVSSPVGYGADGSVVSGSDQRIIEALG